MAVLGTSGASAEYSPRSRWISDDDKPEIGHRTFVAALFLLAILILTLWATSGDRVGDRHVSHDFGLFVSAALSVFIIGAAFGPGVAERLQAARAWLEEFGRSLWPFAVPVLLADVALRRGIAPLAGLRLRQWWLRYPLLVLLLLPALIAGWHHHHPIELPTNSVAMRWTAGGFDLLSAHAFWVVATSFVVLLAVVRQWFWNEARFSDPTTPPEVTEHLTDLRDEALVAILIFFAALPLAMSLLPDAWFGWCEGDQYPACPRAAKRSLLDWYRYFGAELLRAVPVVDWAEVYDVERGDGIAPILNQGLIAVFIIRAVVDLVLIGSILHAIERVGRLSQQERAFRAGQIDIVDPQLEHKFIRIMLNSTLFSATTPPEWVGNFANYDEGRLRRFAEHPQPRRRALVYHALVADEREAKEVAFLAERLSGAEGVPAEKNEELQEMIIGLLGKPNVDGRRDLREIAQNPGLRSAVRKRAIDALIDLGASSSVFELRQIAAQDTNGHNRIASLEALAELPDPDIDVFLEERGNEDRAKYVKKEITRLRLQRFEQSLTSRDPRKT